MLLLSSSVSLLILSSDNNKILNNNLLVVLGLISYPLYLWHYPLIAFSNILGFDLWVLPFLQLFLSIVLGWLTYRYIEIKTRKITEHSSLLLMVLLLMALGLLGAYIKNSKGLPLRAHIQTALVQLKQIERPPAVDEHCSTIVKSSGIPERLFHYCRATTTDFHATFTALIGDSHAQAFYTGLADALKKNKLETILMSNTGCPSFIGGAMGKNLPAVEECDKKINQIYDTLNKLVNLKKVIFIARGSIYIDEKGYGTAESYYEQTVPKYRSYYYQKEKYNPAIEYFSSLEQSVKFFQSKNIETYLILENPELGISPATCVNRPYNISSKLCRVRYNNYRERMKTYRTNIEILKRKYPALTLLDPGKFLCDATWCYAKKDGKLLYSDDDHLSIYGSKYIAEKLINQIVN